MSTTSAAAARYRASRPFSYPSPGFGQQKTKIVYVDHDTGVVSAEELERALEEGFFEAEVRHDGGEDVATPLTAFVQSSLRIGNVTEKKELEMFMKEYCAKRLESFKMDFEGGTMDVVHNPLLLSLEELVKSFKEQLKIDAAVERDGAKDTVWDFPEVVEEEVIVEQTQKPKPLILLSGLFWIISLFYLVGGNWGYLKYVAIISIVVGLTPIGIKAFHKLRLCQFDTNVLMFSAAIGALAYCKNWMGSIR